MKWPYSAWRLWVFDTILNVKSNNRYPASGWKTVIKRKKISSSLWRNWRWIYTKRHAKSPNFLCQSNIAGTCVDVIRNSSEALKFPWFHMRAREKRFWKICTHVQPSTRECNAETRRRAQFYCRSESLVCSNIWRAADWDFLALRSTVDCICRVPFVMTMLSYLRDREWTKARRTVSLKKKKRKSWQISIRQSWDFVFI